MQLSNAQYKSVVNEPEIIGYDFTPLIGPAVNLATNVISNVGRKPSAPPPPPPIPWIPISIAGGTVVLLVVILSMKR